MAQGQPVDAQHLAKCAALDIVGLTSFKHGFGALGTAQGHASSTPDMVGQLQNAELGIRWLSMDVPLPDRLVPGYRRY